MIKLGAIIARPVRDGVALDEATVAAFARMNPQDFSDAGEAAKQSIGWLAETCGLSTTSIMPSRPSGRGVCGVVEIVAV
jgi:hypothetical protein